MVAFWLTGLFGLVGARVFVFRDRWARLMYLMVMVYLLAVLLLWVVPNLFAAQATIDVGRILIRYVLPFCLLAMMALPPSKELAESVRTVDFIYSLLLFMLLALVVLGSLAFMTLGQQDYLDALDAHAVPDRFHLAGIRGAVEPALWFQRAAGNVFALSVECRDAV